MSTPSAPVRVPVELRLAGTRSRWFRLASAVSDEGLLFPRPLPDELDGPVTVTFHLPEDAEPLAFDARVIEMKGEVKGERRGEDDRPRKTAVRFIRPDEAARARVQRYVEARLLQT